MRQAVVSEPFAPGIGIVGDAEQHLLTDVLGAPLRFARRQGRRQDHHQLFGVQTMADQPWQVVGGDHDGGVDAAGGEVHRFDP
ncbi:hypothetical protein D3C84_855700 [compost metagenome]